MAKVCGMLMDEMDSEEECMSDERITRREIIKKAAYIAPLIFTVKANFAFASAGSGDYHTDVKNQDNQKNKDKQDYQNNFQGLTNKTKY
jgi:hypothetical protein